MAQEGSLEDCVKKVQIVEVDGKEWLRLEKRCSCQYFDKYRLAGEDFLYCKNRKVYFSKKESGLI